MSTYFETYILNGGPLMAVLILCSIVLVGSIVQAMVRLRPKRIVPGGVLKAADKTVNKNDQLGFARDLDEQSSPLARALSMTLKGLDLRSGHRPHRRQVEPLVEESVAHVVDDLYEELGTFSTIYTVAPLLGLLGTILGMMNAFREFASQVDKDLSLLSKGIQEALVTTLWGLGIAICAYVTAQVFQSKIRRYERHALPDQVHEVVAALFTHATQSEPMAGAPSRPEDSETAPAGPTGASPQAIAAAGAPVERNPR